MYLRAGEYESLTGRFVYCVSDHGFLDPLRLTGQVSWCESVSTTFARCYAVLMHGTFVAAVQVGAGDGDKGKTVLADVVPATTKALANVG